MLIVKERDGCHLTGVAMYLPQKESGDNVFAGTAGGKNRNKNDVARIAEGNEWCVK